MNEILRLVIFTVVPAGALILGIVYSLYEITRIGERRLAVIVVILGFMLFHQTGELAYFVSNRFFRDPLVGEVPETAANTFAAGSVYYLLRVTRREQRLKEQITASKAETERIKDRLQLIFENVNDGILLVDTEHDEIIEANSSACEMLRYAKEDLIGLSPYALHPHEPERFKTLTDTVRTDGGVTSDQLSCRRKDGSTMPAAVSASRTTFDGTNVLLVTIRDNTEQERYRTQAALLSRVLRHNLRNEMNVVMGHLGMIETSADDPKIETNAEASLEKCQELIEVSEQTRKLSDILDTERARFSRQTDLVSVVETVVDRIEAEYPRATINTELPDSAPVQASDNIGWAVENIVENAIVHADRESPTVDIRITEETVTEDGISSEWRTVRVADDGPGIPRTEVEVLRDDTKRTSTEHGSGLGLWIALQLVRIFDGKLHVDRNPSEHSTEVSLRLLPADEYDHG